MTVNADGQTGDKHAPVRRIRNSAWFFFFLLLNFAVNSLKGILLVPLYLSCFDSRLYGAWLATGEVVGILAFMDLGIGRVLLQKIAEKSGRGEPALVAELVTTGAWSYLVICALPVMFGVMLSPYVADFVQIELSQKTTLTSAYLLMIAATGVSLYFNGIAAILHGLQRQALIGVIGVSGLVLSALVTVGLLLEGYGLASIPLGSLVGASCSLIVSSVCLMKIQRGLLVRGRFRCTLFKEIAGESIPLFGSGAAYAAVNRMPLIILAHWYDPAYCNVFAFTNMAPTILTNIATYVSHAAGPSLAHFAGERDTGGATSAISFILYISVLCALLFMAGAGAFNHQFIQLWVGDQYYGGAVLNGLFCITGVITTIFIGLNNMALSLGHFSFCVRSNWFKTGLNIPLLLALAPMGMLGLAAAGALSLLFAVLMQSQAFRNVSPAVERPLLPYSLVYSGVVLVVIAHTAGHLFPPDGMWAFGASAALFLTAALLTLIALHRRRLVPYFRKLIGDAQFSRSR